MSAKTYVNIEIQDAVFIARLYGELDHHSVQSLRQEIDAAALQNQPKELILDFTGVSFMDSSGIGLVMGRYRLAQELNAQLRLCGLTASTRRVMQIAGMDKLAKF